MYDEIINQLKCVKATANQLMLLSDETRNLVLLHLADSLRTNKAEICLENQKDLIRMDKVDPKYDRLLLTDERIEQIANDVELIASLPNCIGNQLSETKRPNGLIIKKVTVPLGVVAVIYESRPNVTIDVFSLCFKTGNACVLKGGKEAYNTNAYLIKLIHKSLQTYDIDLHAVYLLPPKRETLSILLEAIDFVDVCVPRGSQDLIHFVRHNAKIPVIETGAGIVHVYFDQSGDVEKGRLIINNAKTRRVSVCNALDTLIIHEKRLSDLNRLIELLVQNKVELFADTLSYQALKGIYPKNLIHLAKEADYGHEFLSYKMSIKIVQSIEEAVSHIRNYSSKHSEAIIAEDEKAITYFLNQVDAAVVYANASTAFTDGGQFGMGAEIGISTQKMHARGPMGLDALMSYKWIVLGEGQIRS